MLDDPMMSDPSAESLPEFERPPVVEVALAVQFEPIEELRVPQIGLLWNDFRDRYPRTEEHPRIQPKIEQFGVRVPAQPAVDVQFMEKPPTPRCWFLNQEGSRLVQVQ